MKGIRGVLAFLLAAVLAFAPVLPVSAAEVGEETTEMTEVPETAGEPETTPAAETEATEPEETDPVVETTEAVTEPAEEEFEPAETEETQTEETEPADIPVFFAEEPAISTIAEAQSMSSGTKNICIQGTVVYAAGIQAVLQDNTGGIRLSFSEAPEIALGDVLQVTGARVSGFSVQSWETVGIADLPAEETTLLEAPENLRIRVADAQLGKRVLRQGDYEISLKKPSGTSLTEGDWVTAYGVILDGCFYADSLIPQEAPEAETLEWNTYFGLLHAHTNISDGTGSVSEAFNYAAEVEGLDFFAVTDHSNSFDNADKGAIDEDGADVSEEWKAGKEAAAEVTDEAFVGIFGYEMTWPEDAALGHINTFNTPGWQTREQEGFQTLTTYYDVLLTVPGSISQFNHPGYTYGDFRSFGHYSPDYDSVIQLLEVGGEGGMTAYEFYVQALDAGWHVAPTNSQNNHNGSWGDASSARTAVLAKALTEESLYEAMSSRRVYATEDSDLTIHYYLNGNIMGSIMGTAESLTVTGYLSDPTDGIIGTVEVIVDGGETAASRTVEDEETTLTMAVPAGYSYYYLRITQPDGDIAVTAPVWVDAYEDMGIAGFTSSQVEPEAGETVRLSVEVFNNEAVDFVLESLEISCNGTVIYADEAPGTVAELDNCTYSWDFTHPEAGEVVLTAKVTGSVNGQERTYEKELTLHYQPDPEELTNSTIAAARAGTVGCAFRVTGYVTAGNSNPYNTFPNTIYIQDDTGGIAVVGQFEGGIQLGAPMAVTGCLREEDGNLVLELVEYDMLDEDYEEVVPRTMTHEVAMNYDTHGGELLQIEGEVVSFTKTSDGNGIARFTIKDILGDLATVVIEDYIGSGAYGTNELASQVKKGRTVRAMGLLHMDEYGTPVLRVRNCEEVVYVPPTKDPTNPKTGDLLFHRK